MVAHTTPTVSDRISGEYMYTLYVFEQMVKWSQMGLCACNRRRKATTTQMPFSSAKVLKQVLHGINSQYCVYKISCFLFSFLKISIIIEVSGCNIFKIGFFFLFHFLRSPERNGAGATNIGYYFERINAIRIFSID